MPHVFLHLQRNRQDVAVIPGTVLRDDNNYGTCEGKTNVSTGYCFSPKETNLRLRLSRNGNFDSVFGMDHHKKKHFGSIDLEMDIETCTIKESDLKYLLDVYKPKS